MKTKFKHISKQVIVITGASSGIGLATALAAAKRGARVVLASRNEKALSEAQKRIDLSGGESTYVVADVADMADVQKIAQTAIDTYGGFDTWVNNAGVGIIGKMEDISDEDHRRLFDTNFWGIVNGSKIAAAHLKEKGGKIVNLGSVLSDIAVPEQGMYSASKHAVKGFTDALRMELQLEDAPVYVTLIKPAAIATPFFNHAENYTMQQAKAPPPVYAPEEVASAILYAATHDIRDLNVGGAGPLMAFTRYLSPRFADMMGRSMSKQQFANKPKSRRKDNLHEAGIDGETRDRNTSGMPSLYTRALTNPYVTVGAVAAVGAAAAFFVGRNRMMAPKFLNRNLTAKLSKHLPDNISTSFMADMAPQIAKLISRNLPDLQKQLKKTGPSLPVNKLAITGLLASLLKGKLPTSKSGLVAQGVMHVLEKKAEKAQGKIRDKATKLVA